MFGKKKTIETPIQAPKPLPKSSNTQIEPIEAEEVPEEQYSETEEVGEEYGDSEETESNELTESTIVAYLKNYGERLSSIESTLFRLKGAL